jgi:hypothetical protein
MLTGSVWGQTYTIKIKNHPDEGKSAINKDFNSNSGTFKLLDADGKVVNQNKTTMVQEQEYTQTVLVGGEERPAKHKKTYTKALKRLNDKETKLTYAGRAVVFEFEKGKYKVFAEGEPPLAPKDLEDLAKQANDPGGREIEKLVLPGKPVKVGDRWALDSKALAKIFKQEAKLDSEKTKASASLAKVYRKGESQYGVLEIDLKMAVEEMQGLKFEKPAAFDMRFTLDAPIDGSDTAGVMTMTGKIVGKSSLEEGGKKFNLEVALDMSGKLEVSSQK